MSYPSSSDVAAGDLTAASQYNNLRADALRLGQAAADAVNLGAMLELYESNLKIIRLNTTQLRIEASLTSPVSLNVYGYPVRTTANVDLAIGDAPSGAAATYYIFANRAAASTSFTLSVSTSATEAANQRRIGKFYWDGTEIVRESIQTELSMHVSTLLKHTEDLHQCGRLTLATNDPVPTSNIAVSSMVYFTPYKGNRISLYVPGYGWRVHTFSELSLDISGYSINTNYDIFIYDNAGTLTLEGVAWSNATLRAVALVSQDGRWVKNGYPHKLYLGTIRCNGVGSAADTYLARLCWNNYNRVPRQLKIVDSTNSWTYNVALTFRPWNNDSTNKVEYVVGLVEDMLQLVCVGSAYFASSAFTAYIGIGVDSTAASTPTISSPANAPAGSIVLPMAAFNDYPTLGYHYLCMLEAVGTAIAITFYGDNGTTYHIAGGYGWILA